MLSFEEKGELAAFLIQERNGEELRLERLKAQVREGFESLDRGEGIRLEDEAELSDFMSDVKRRGQARLAELR